MPGARTSQTDPLLIAELPTGERGGCVGVTLCPGRQGTSQFAGLWRRDLDADLDRIRDWGALHVLTLVEPHELQALGVEGLGDAVRARGIHWHHLPIRDMHAPGHRFHAAWPALLPQLQLTLRQGGRILIHCRAGLGRAGTVAAMLLIAGGEKPGDAMARVRKARPGAIESGSQEAFLVQYDTQPLA